MTWLIAIARNRAIDHLRTRGQNRYMDPLEVAAELADAFDLVINAQTARKWCLG